MSLGDCTLSDDLKLVEPFVSSTTDNIYAIFGLPEEVISVLFAYVSRSPLSFRENLAKLLKDGDMLVNPDHRLTGTTERARKFHEKWVIGYGHSSVAEHTTIHIGIEKISRIASEQLERSNPYLSFTEYSQRYQMPKKGDWYIPEEAIDLFEPFYEDAYDAYSKAVDDLVVFLAGAEPDLTDNQREKRAIEEARYLLPLGMYTNLGMTGNARAISEALEILWYNPNEEVRQMANGIVKAAQHVAPTLIRHPFNSSRRLVDNETWRTTYIKPYLEGIYDIDITALISGSTNWFIESPVVFIPDEDSVLFSHDRLLAMLGLAGSHAWIRAADDKNIDIENLRRSLQDNLSDILSNLGKHDKLPMAFENIVFRSFWRISEAAWHQLLRHRRASFVADHPSAIRPHYIPRLFIRAAEAGYEQPLQSLRELAWRSRELYAEALCRFSDHGYKQDYGKSIASYAVLNASTRDVYATMSLRTAWDLLRLRTRPNAQEEIRLACGMLADVLSQDKFLGSAGQYFRLDRHAERFRARV